MKFLSHFTIRAFVVLGLSLGCANAQMSKEEVMLFFEGIDVTKTGCYLITDGRMKDPKTYEEIWPVNVPTRKIVFLKNSFLVTKSNVKAIYSYRHIKQLTYGLNPKTGEATIWMVRE